MQRLVLAILLLAALVGLFSFVLMGVRTVLRSQEGSVARVATADGMQKFAFFLLVALILYVSASGGS